MARCKDARVTERNEGLCADVAENGPKSYKDLARTHGMSAQMVYRILASAEMVSKDNPRPRDKTGNGMPISNGHLFLGKVIETNFLEHTLSNKNDGKKSDLAAQLRLSPQRLNGIIRGTDDPTLSEIERIGAWIDMPAWRVLQLATEQSDAACKP